MSLSTLILVLAILCFGVFVVSRQRSLSLARAIGGQAQLNSLPMYYGMMAAIWCLFPALLVIFVWTIFDGYLIETMVIQSLPESERQISAAELGLLINSVENLASNPSALTGNETPVMIDAANRLADLNRISDWSKAVVVLLVAMIFGAGAWLKVHPELRARNFVEKIFRSLLLASSSLAILVTVGIVLSVLFESLRFFQVIPVTDFVFGLHWSPQTAIHADQVGGSGSFGAVPLFAGTLLISAIAMLVAVPSGLMAAIYLSEYADRRVRAIIKPVLEVLAGIPTVVYGFFAALTVAPALRDFLESIGIAGASSESALAAGAVMGVMIIPMVSSLSDDVINAVPNSLRDGSYGLGATKSETIKKVVIPAALPGIVGGILLAVSRAIGETMIVVMAAGLAANLTANPLESVTTVTVQIVTLLVGDQEFDSPKTLAAFALGLVLFLVTLTLNFIALHVVKKYREQYE
ncbi:phosphate ABC transporter permease subunit PstC [Sessilibacter sp. MAH2]